MRAIFLDRDGTINKGIPFYRRVDRLEKVQLLPQVLEGLNILAGLDYLVFFVTNQAGIAEGLMTLTKFYEINDKVLKLIEPTGIKVSETYVCPHGEHENCTCHKPKPKMILDAAAKYGIDLEESYMIGDRLTDIHTGINAGTKTILVQTGEPVSSDKATYTAANLLDAARYIAAN